MKNWKSAVYVVSAIQIGAGMAIIGVMAFLPLFLSQIGITDSGEAAFWSGILTAVTPLTLAISSPFWSLEAKKRGAKPVMVMILLVVAVSATLCSFTNSPWQLLVLRTAQGLAGGFIPIGLSIVTEITPEEKTSWAMGFFQAALVAGTMLGPLAGGIVADIFGYRAPFLFFALLLVLCALATKFFLPEVNKTSDEKEDGSSMFSQIAYFIKIPEFRVLAAIQFLCNFGITGMGPIFPLYLEKMVGGEATAIASLVGFLIFLSGGADALASLSAGTITQRFDMKKVLFVSTIFVGFTFIFQYLMTTVWGLGAFRVVTGLGIGIIMPITNTLIVKSVPPEKRSIVFGVVASISMLGNVAGPATSGVLAMYMGYASVFWLTAFAFFLGGILFFITDRRKKAV